MFFFMILQDKRVCTCDLHFSVLGSLGSKPPLVELSRPAGALSWPILCRCVGHRPDADPTRDDVTMVENCIERWGPDNIYNEFQWIVAKKQTSQRKRIISKEILSQKLLQTSSNHVFPFKPVPHNETIVPWQGGRDVYRALHFDLIMLIYFDSLIQHKNQPH